MRKFGLFVVIFITVSSIVSANFSTRHTAGIYTNQTMVERLNTFDALDIDDGDAVLAAVTRALPETITVYPTEGYYYFWFYHKGNLVRGNLRFAYDHRDKGELPFAWYYEVFGRENENRDTHYRLLKPSRDFQLKKTGENRYVLTFRQRKIQVNLAIPETGYIPRKNEKYIGALFDESGIVFDLVFNESTNAFYYLLDRNKDYEFQYSLSSHVSVGARSGFIYYDLDDELVLVGVNKERIRRNTFYDGPFDQLPEYNLEKAGFKDLLARAYPDVKGRIDTHGNFLDRDSLRVAVDNYRSYKHMDEFADLESCADETDEWACVQKFLSRSPE